MSAEVGAKMETRANQLDRFLGSRAHSDSRQPADVRVARKGVRTAKYSTGSCVLASLLIWEGSTSTCRYRCGLYIANTLGANLICDIPVVLRKRNTGRPPYLPEAQSSAES